MWTENHHVLRDCGCGLRYIEPTPGPTDVDQTIDHHTPGYYRYPAHVRAAFVQRLKPGGRLLEVGCGDGSFLRAAHDHGLSVSGLEADPSRAYLAARATGFTIESGFVEDAAPTPEPFDVVFHVDLLSHFPDPVRSLRAMTAQLGDGGVLCLEVGIMSGMSPQWYRWMGGVGIPWHRALYSEDAVRATLAKADLEVVDVQRFSLLAAMLLGRMRRLLRTLAGRGRDYTVEVDRSGDTSWLLRASDWIEYVLRYRVGRYLPRLGPLTVLVAARPTTGNARSGELAIVASGP